VRARRHSTMPAIGLEDENLDPFAASADGDEVRGELVDDQKALKRARELFQTIPSLHTMQFWEVEIGTGTLSQVTQPERAGCVVYPPSHRRS